MKFVGLIEKLEQKILCLYSTKVTWRKGSLSGYNTTTKESAGKQMTHVHKRKRKYTMGDLSIWAVYLYSHLSPIYPAGNITYLLFR